MRDLSYGEIKKWLTRHENGKLIPAVSDGLGLLAVFTLLGLGATPALIALTADLLTIRTELSNSAKMILSWFHSDNKGSPVDRVQRMRVAYGLLACSAFFDAVQLVMPSVLGAFKLTKEDKTRLVTSALARIKLKRDPEEDELNSDLWTQPLLPFPHPTDDWDQQQRELNEVFEAIATGLAASLPCLAHWDDLDDTKREALLGNCAKLPKEALSCFEAQYTTLAADCHEFRVWARRQEYISGQRQLDSGMRQLQGTIRSLYGAFRHQEIEDISATLRTRYLAQVEKPLLREKEISDDLPPGVTLPRKTDAFIPQSFKVVRYEANTPIGSEDMWNRLTAQQDLPDFLWSYIHSPYSELYPLVILGHPGSGKSLLTEIFAARLADSPFTPIRVVLRDIAADARLRDQIDEQLANDVDSGAKWSRMRPRFVVHPAVVIFDGYDELLLASDQVFANYIVDIQEFQRDEKVRSQSGLRAIITSRSTLIEKARIPKGTTVIRLLPFDEKQRNKWVNTWNTVNVDGFREHGIRRFKIPASVPALELAEQPLLLLMLAIYDSYGNALSEHDDVSRVSLYSKLVSLFIHRECLKDQAFRDLDDNHQSLLLAKQRKHLGVCALGMFNRERLSITQEELADDLAQFGLVPDKPANNQRLQDVDSVFGSFFFIHRSQAKQADGPNSQTRRLAYEFLHNTIGEYLCAEFLYRRVLELVAELTSMKMNPRLVTYREKVLDDPNQLGDDWYGCWISTPLSTRPVLVEMIQEIALADLESQAQSDEIQEFESLIQSHLGLVLGGKAIPSAMLAPSVSLIPASVLTRIAVYTLNLLIVQCALHPGGYQLTYSRLTGYLGEQDPWDRMAHFWLAALPDGARWSISGLLQVLRTDDGIDLQLRQPFETAIAGSSTRAFNELALSIGNELRDESARLPEMLLSSISHQLGVRVGGLAMTAEFMMDSDYRNDKNVQRLREEVRRLGDFIKNFRTIGNITSQKKVTTESKQTTLEEVIVSVVTQLGPQAETSRITIEAEYPKSYSFVVDKGLLHEALINVVSNAIEASNEGGRIQIKGSIREGSQVVILIQDEGPGLSTADASRIFQLFYTTKPRGTGLGLFITKQILKTLGGSIELLSSGFSRGTTMMITLPTKPNPSSSQRSS